MKSNSYMIQNISRHESNDTNFVAQKLVPLYLDMVKLQVVNTKNVHNSYH
jgi:hypothetical protein